MTFYRNTCSCRSTAVCFDSTDVAFVTKIVNNFNFISILLTTEIVTNRSIRIEEATNRTIFWIQNSSISYSCSSCLYREIASRPFGMSICVYFLCNSTACIILCYSTAEVPLSDGGLESDSIRWRIVYLMKFQKLLSYVLNVQEVQFCSLTDSMKQPSQLFNLPKCI